MTKKMFSPGNIWKIAAVLYLAAVAFLCFGHFSSDPSIPKDLFGIPIDKVVHFSMFLPFPVIGVYAFHTSRGRFWRFILFISLTYLLGMILAFGTEYLQGLTAYRSSDPADFIADSLGLAAGTLIVIILKSIRLKW